MESSIFLFKLSVVLESENERIFNSMCEEAVVTVLDVFRQDYSAPRHQSRERVNAQVKAPRHCAGMGKSDGVERLSNESGRQTARQPDMPSPAPTSIL